MQITLIVPFDSKFVFLYPTMYLVVFLTDLEILE